MKGALEVSPNPVTKGFVTIKSPGATPGSWLSIQNSNGLEIMRMLMPEKELRLPVTVLSVGIHFIKVWNQLETKHTRLIIR